MQTGNEQHLSRLAYALLARLTELNDKFREHKSLAPDGSFFQTNEQLSKWLRCTRNGLQKARHRLTKENKIRFEPSFGRGKASLYWIGDKKPSKKKSEILPELERFWGTTKRHTNPQ